jgi:osmotically-inducible protein OsmY
MVSSSFLYPLEALMARNQQYGDWRRSREDGDRSNQYRSREEDDREFDEGDSSVRAGDYDQGRAQFGRRDSNEQSGSTGRYAGHEGSRGNTGQGRYGQSGYGGGGYDTGSRQDRGGGDYGYSGYGGQGQRDWQSRRSFSDYDVQSGGSRGPGYGAEGDYWRGQDQGGRYSQGTFGTERSGWSEPFGEGQQQYSPESGGRGMHRGKGPKGYQRSDERLKEMLCERLRDDPEIDPSEVTISVAAGRVTLEGTVDSRQTKNRIEDVAEQFGVQEVQNNLRVQRGQPAFGTSSGRAIGSSNEEAEQSATSKQKRN